MGTKKKTKTTYNDHSTNAPPAWTQGGLTQAGSMVQNALGQIPASHYTGQQVAYMSPDQLAGIQGAWGNTADLAGQYTQYMQDQLPALTAQPQFSTSLPTANYNMGDRYAGLEGTINAAQHSTLQQLMENILPGIKSSALDAGAYSGDRAMGVLPTSAVQNATESMQRIASELAFQDYQDWENRRLAAYQGDQATQLGAYQADTSRQLGLADNNNAQMQLLPQYIQSMLHTSGSVGDLLNMSAALGVQNQQAQIGDALAQDRYASYSPFMGLDQASQLLAQLSGNWGTQDRTGSSKTTETTGGLGPALQTAAGIASMAMGMPGMGGGGGMAGLLGAGAGSLGGAAGAAPSWINASNLFPSTQIGMNSFGNFFGG